MFYLTTVWSLKDNSEDAVACMQLLHACCRMQWTEQFVFAGHQTTQVQV